MPNDYLTIPQAAEVIGIRRESVHQAIERGHIRAERLGPRAWMIERAEVERYRDSERKPGPKPNPPPIDQREAKQSGAQIVSTRKES